MDFAKSEKIIEGARDVIQGVGAALAGGVKHDETTTTTDSNGNTDTVTESKPWWSELWSDLW